MLKKMIICGMIFINQKALCFFSLYIRTQTEFSIHEKEIRPYFSLLTELASPYSPFTITFGYYNDNRKEISLSHSAFILPYSYILYTGMGYDYSYGLLFRVYITLYYNEYMTLSYTYYDKSRISSFGFSLGLLIKDAKM